MAPATEELVRQVRRLPLAERDALLEAVLPDHEDQHADWGEFDP